MTGLIHLYTGEGKGKTTAALGLLLRAHGCGKRIVFAQFLKGRSSGEIRALSNLNDVIILRQSQDRGFYKTLDDAGKAEVSQQNSEILVEAYRLAVSGSCDLMILDEVCAAYANNVIDAALMDKLIVSKPPEMELVLTGRNAPTHFLEAADYVTEFVKRKHPFDKGIAAREGVEF